MTIISNIIYKGLFLKSSVFVEIDLRRSFTHEIKTIARYGIFLTDVSGQPIGSHLQESRIFPGRWDR
jgi:hypothetical protein